MYKIQPLSLKCTVLSCIILAAEFNTCYLDLLALTVLRVKGTLLNR